ncbi:MAG: alanine--glyoxylate aminotransferase family protein [Candidatus Tectomicrobia bacterium]|uniref:Alanine--glyoxylate aminotransferase family protein n=1 Tax=Tectimicrobiota bacterium TaxID=2528274 RepID=A0A932GRM9_UNCTE|nr:alanine--glyoxylate aminotransferase family protein [Candidatus Tectomicrobia bacterium]
MTTESKSFGEFSPPVRLLLGPGPSNLHPRVVRALSAPILGYLDPYFLTLLDETMELLRALFRTANRLTFPLSGPGTAGMEAVLANMVEAGDRVAVGVNGLFGQRMAEIVRRHGGELIEIAAAWGSPIDPAQIEEVLKTRGPIKAVALIHGETSTGVLQPLSEIGRLCREHQALFIVDTVTSLGGAAVEVDSWHIDLCYSGTQKCLNAPPGLSPLTLSDRALEAIKARKSPCGVWYLDLKLIEQYWSRGRVYHHTPPTLLIYALREALRVILEEGLEARFDRHRRAALALYSGLAALGFELHVPTPYRLPSLTTVKIPSGLDEARTRQSLLEDHNIEIGAGLGPLRGKVWRIGLMGQNATLATVLTLLSALEQILRAQGRLEKPGASLQTAEKAFLDA